MSEVMEPLEEEETSQEDKTSGGDNIIEGKRTKKTVERLDFQAPKQKEKLKIGNGSGDKFGDIPRINLQITKMKPADLKPLHAIVFDRPGKMGLIKKNLRLFNGFAFDSDSEQFMKKREKILKSVRSFTNSKLKVVCGILDLEKKGTHSDLVERILGFLVAPKNSGKRLPMKKKRKSKKKLSGDDSKTKTKKKSKSEPRSSSSSPKKSKSGSKSKAIVMDSSSDEDEEEEKGGAMTETKGSDTEEKHSEEEEEELDKSEGEDDEDKESPKLKKKMAAAKRQRTPAKKVGPPKKIRKRDVSEQSDGDSEVEEKNKKKTPSVKPATKTKKANSSSNRKNNNTAEDSSDEDEPFLRMIKKSPSEEQLKEMVQSFLKEADHEEMTMKQICQRVFDTFPEHDLSSKKDFIKQTVKSLIT